MYHPVLRCLIVDGNFLIGLDLEEILRSLNFNGIHRATNFAQAAAALEAESYALVFIDLELDRDKVAQLTELAAVNGAECIFTSTDFDGHEYPVATSKASRLTKPYSPAAIKSIVNSIATIGTERD